MPKEDSNKEGSKLNFCHHCGKLFHLKWQLTAHIKVHEKKKTPHICPICPSSFARNWDLKIHLKSHSSERPFKCKFCNKGFKSKFSKECHEDTHGIKSYKCPICDESFPTYMKMNRHKKHRHKKTVIVKENGQVHYKCAFCSSLFLSLELKKNHEATVHHREENDHIAVQASKCPICLEKFPNGRVYRAHVYEFHPSEAENIFYSKCKVCNKKVSSAFFLYHMNAHNGIKPHACSVCDKKFTRKHDLIRHVGIHTNETPFVCNQCPKKFKCKKNLIMHYKSHLEKDQYCDLCNKSFNSKEKVANHKKRVHLREQNLEKCPVCDKEVFNEYMSRHMKEFHCFEEKLCDYCGQTFKNSFKLSLHISKNCKETAKYKSRWIAHQRAKAHHALDPTSVESSDSLISGYVKECFLCGLTFTHQKLFMDHVRFHEYNNWKFSWNATDIYREKKINFKDGSKNNREELIITKDASNTTNYFGALANSSVISKYDLLVNIKKEITWIPQEDKRKKLSSNNKQNNNSGEKMKLLLCNHCKTLNKVKDNNIPKYICHNCSNLNDCSNSLINPQLSLDPMHNNTISMNPGLSNLNFCPPPMLPIILVGPPMPTQHNTGNIQQNLPIPQNLSAPIKEDRHSNEKDRHSNDIKTEIKVEELPFASYKRNLPQENTNQALVNKNIALKCEDLESSEMKILIDDEIEEIRHDVEYKSTSLEDLSGNNNIDTQNSQFNENLHSNSFGSKYISFEKSNNKSYYKNRIIINSSAKAKNPENTSEKTNDKTSSGNKQNVDYIKFNVESLTNTNLAKMNNLNDKEKITKKIKDKLALLQGKQFISIDDLKKLKDCNINDLLDFL